MGCVTPKILARISKDTAFEMWARLHQLYLVKSAIGENSYRRQLYNLRFIMGNDMQKFVEKFENIVSNIQQSGGTCGVQEEINAFKMSLPDEFTTTIEWSEGLPIAERTPETLKLKAGERNRRYMESNRLVSRLDHVGVAQSSQKSNGRNQKRNNGNSTGNFNDRRSNSSIIKCFSCGEVKHKSFF